MRQAAAFLRKDMLARAEALVRRLRAAAFPLATLFWFFRRQVIARMTRAKILNVDDQPISRYIRTQVLEQAGYEVIEASTGDEALRRLSSDRPQLVLLDMNLPDILGVEVCRRIRAQPSTRSIVVLHISATQTSLQDRVFGLDGGADGYLVEPVEPDLLLATVRSSLRLWQAEARLEESLSETRALAARYQSLTEAVPHIVYTTTADGQWDYVSQQFADYAGRDTAEALGAGWLSLVHPEDREARSGILAARRRTRRAFGKRVSLPAGGRLVPLAPGPGQTGQRW